MKSLRFLIIALTLAVLLPVLCSCNLLNLFKHKRPQHSAAVPPSTAAVEHPADDAAANDEAAAQLEDDAVADAADSAGDSGEPAEDGSADAGGDSEATADEEQTDQSADAGAAARPAAGLDLSGSWLPLYSRDRSGVQPELWKSGLTYFISGDQRNLDISAADGGFYGNSESVGKLQNVRLSQHGPFLIVDQASEGRSAYLRLGSAGELAAAGELSGQLAGQKYSGSFTNSASGLKLEFGPGMHFSGKAQDGSFFGFLEGGSKRGYCVLTLTGNGILEGILFEDPYMSFVTDLHFEVMP